MKRFLVLCAVVCSAIGCVGKHLDLTQPDGTKVKVDINAFAQDRDVEFSLKRPDGTEIKYRAGEKVDPVISKSLEVLGDALKIIRAAGLAAAAGEDDPN